MKLSDTSENYSLNKNTYINLRWIGIIGQFITINIVSFILKFEFNYILANIVVFFGTLSNLSLIYFFKKKTQLSEKTSFYFLFLDIFQLSFLLYLTGGTVNPFSIFLLIPSIFASTSLNLKTNIWLIIITTISIVFITFIHEELPAPLNDYIFNKYYYYSVPIALFVALIFLNYFAITIGKESRIRKEAINKIQEIISKEHELLSLGGQAAAAAHSLGTPLSTIKIISDDLFDQLKNDKNFGKDVDLLVSQVSRCNEILKKLTLNPTIEDDFLDKNLSLYDYVKEIVLSFEEISEKKFNIDIEQNANSFDLNKSIEIVYGLRNCIGNANKFAKKNIFISIKSDSNISEITIEDDGPGFSRDILNKIGEPYLKSLRSKDNNKSGLGLGIFIGKTLLEKNNAKIIFRNSETRKGAEIKIEWSNKYLLNI